MTLPMSLLQSPEIVINGSVRTVLSHRTQGDSLLACVYSGLSDGPWIGRSRSSANGIREPAAIDLDSPAKVPARADEVIE
jgi:hypothetical protein